MGEDANRKETATMFSEDFVEFAESLRRLLAEAVEEATQETALGADKWQPGVKS